MLLAAPAGDRLAVQAVRHGDDAAHVRVGAADLLDDERVRDHVEPHPAVLLGQRRGQEAELGELGDDAAVDRLRAVPLGRVRRDLARRRTRAWSAGSAPARRRASSPRGDPRWVQRKTAWCGERFRPPHRPAVPGLHPSRLLGGASTYLRAAPGGSANVGRVRAAVQEARDEMCALSREIRSERRLSPA